MNYGLKDITNIAINPIDITKLEDGVYTVFIMEGGQMKYLLRIKIVSIDVLRKSSI